MRKPQTTGATLANPNPTFSVNLDANMRRIAAAGAAKQGVTVDAYASGLVERRILEERATARRGKREVLNISGDWGSFTFPANPTAVRQFEAAAKYFNLDPSKVIFEMVSAAVEKLVAMAAKEGGSAQ